VERRERPQRSRVRGRAYVFSLARQEPSRMETSRVPQGPNESNPVRRGGWGWRKKRATRPGDDRDVHTFVSNATS
jgi:hypothetical protein